MASSFSILPPGTVLAGRFRLGEILGKGGMGTVYLAEQVGIGQRVVVKTLHDSFARTPGGLERFRLEAEAAGSVSHPNVVQVTEFHTRPGEPAFLVMEYVDGWPLSQFLRDHGALEARRAAHIGVQILGGLGAAHVMGIVHRDMKPANVMLLRSEGAGDFAKLLDFGIARMLDDERCTRLTQTGQLLGTPGYLTPEQALGRPIDERTDLFAVGVVLYAMLTHQLPWEGERGTDRILAMLQTPPIHLGSRRPDLDGELVALVHRAIEKDPNLRFQNALEMQGALSRWLVRVQCPGVPPSAWSAEASQRPGETLDATVVDAPVTPHAATLLPATHVEAPVPALGPVSEPAAAPVPPPIDVGKPPQVTTPRSAPPKGRTGRGPLLVFTAGTVLAVLAAGGVILGLKRLSDGEPSRPHAGLVPVPVPVDPVDLTPMAPTFASQDAGLDVGADVGTPSMRDSSIDQADEGPGDAPTNSDERLASGGERPGRPRQPPSAMASMRPGETPPESGPSASPGTAPAVFNATHSPVSAPPPVQPPAPVHGRGVIRNLTTTTTGASRAAAGQWFEYVRARLRRCLGSSSRGVGRSSISVALHPGVSVRMTQVVGPLAAEHQCIGRAMSSRRGDPVPSGGGISNPAQMTYHFSWM